MPGLNVVEKILCKASGSCRVKPEEFIKVRVDKMTYHDLTSPLIIKAFRRIGARGFGEVAGL